MCLFSHQRIPETSGFRTSPILTVSHAGGLRRKILLTSLCLTKVLEQGIDFEIQKQKGNVDE
jgi:hypothetical protein